MDDGEIQTRSEHGVRLPLARYEDFLRKAARATKLTGGIGLVFTDNKGIRRYNKEYLGKDKPTDVLSFGYDDDETYAGDIIISYEWVRETMPQHKRADEVRALIVHACLHLAGEHHTYDDESLAENRKRMNEIFEIIERNAT